MWHLCVIIRLFGSLPQKCNHNCCVGEQQRLAGTEFDSRCDHIQINVQWKAFFQKFYQGWERMLHHRSLVCHNMLCNTGGSLMKCTAEAVSEVVELALLSRITFNNGSPAAVVKVLRYLLLSIVCFVFTQHAAGPQPVRHIPLRPGGLGRRVRFGRCRSIWNRVGGCQQRQVPVWLFLSLLLNQTRVLNLCSIFAACV